MSIRVLLSSHNQMSIKPKQKSNEICIYLSCLQNLMRHLSINRVKSFCSQSIANEKELELIYENFCNAVKTLKCEVGDKQTVTVTMKREFSSHEISSREVSLYIRSCVWALGHQSLSYKGKELEKCRSDTRFQAIFLLDYIFQSCNPPTKSLQSLSYKAVKDCIGTASTSSDRKEYFKNYLDWVTDDNPTFSEREGDITTKEYSVSIPLESVMYDIFIANLSTYQGPTIEQIKSFVYYSSLTSVKDMVNRTYGRHPLVGNNHGLLMNIQRLLISKPSLAKLLVKVISDTGEKDTIHFATFVSTTIIGYKFSPPLESNENLVMIRHIRKRLNDMKSLYRVQIGCSRKQHIEASLSACITFVVDCMDEFCLTNRI